MKPRTLLTTAALFAAALFILDVPPAYAGDPDPGEYRSVVSPSGNWNARTSSWEVRAADSSDKYVAAESYPQTGDDAIVQSDDIINLTANATCATLDITGIVNTGVHTLTIEDAGGLTIQIDGLLDVTGAGWVVLGGGTHSIAGGGVLDLSVSGSTLNITSSCEITGAGTIDGDLSGAQILIEDGVTFTNTTNITGCVTITEPQNENATFVNGSGGLVHANKACTLQLVTNSLGVSAGNWRVSVGGAFLWLNHGSSAGTHSGDFTVSNGTLDIYETVSTTGGLCFTGGTLDVIAGESFTATGAPASCP